MVPLVSLDLGELMLNSASLQTALGGLRKEGQTAADGWKSWDAPSINDGFRWISQLARLICQGRTYQVTSSITAPSHSLG